MPELPEVETVRRTLEGQIIGKKILKFIMIKFWKIRVLKNLKKV